MKSSFKNFLMAGLLTASLALTACSGFKSKTEVEALNEVQAVGSPFTQNLANEYRLYANALQNQGFDYADALHFARKGLAAAAGETALPEPLSDWNLRPDHITELAPARGALINALDRGAREQLPAEAARAQAKFDCWIEQQEENWNTPGNVTCKSEFEQALAALGNITPMAAPEDMMPPVTAGAQPSTPMAAEDAKYLVFFDFDASRVDQGGNAVLDQVAAEIAKQNISSIRVVGNTDTSGSNEYNERLGQRRAESVRKALAARGIRADMITTESRGETMLMVPTPDGVREPANRRAEITFVK
jgi:OOP family OmpA-OmpF porin